MPVSQAALAGYLGPDFMAGADHVTAWNVFSVTPQSLSHILPMLGRWRRKIVVSALARKARV